MEGREGGEKGMGERMGKGRKKESGIEEEVREKREDLEIEGGKRGLEH